MMRRTAIYGMLFGLLAGMSIIFGAVFVVPSAVALEQAVLPPQKDWHVTEWRIDGDDVVLTGLVTKTRDCEYHPPPRARDELGQNYLVDSASRMKALSWKASPIPQRFGPWRVIGGAGKRLHFYQEFRCHGLWLTMVDLGDVWAMKDHRC